MNEQRVKELLSANGIEWDDFYEWIKGKTVTRLPNGDTSFFEFDVDRFISRVITDRKNKIIRIAAELHNCFNSGFIHLEKIFNLLRPIKDSKEIAQLMFEFGYRKEYMSHTKSTLAGFLNEEISDCEETELVVKTILNAAKLRDYKSPEYLRKYFITEVTNGFGTKYELKYWFTARKWFRMCINPFFILTVIGAVAAGALGIEEYFEAHKETFGSNTEVAQAIEIAIMLQDMEKKKCAEKKREARELKRKKRVIRRRRIESKKI